MTARSSARGNGATIIILLVLGALLLCAMLNNAATVLDTSLDVPNVGSVELQDHATDRHGDEAEAVRAAVGTGGGNHFNCDGGKEYVTTYMGDGKWGLMVIRGGVEQTSFITTQDYIAGRLEDENCKNGWAHP